MKQILATTIISFGVIALLAVGGYWFIQREAAKGEEPPAVSSSVQAPEVQPTEQTLEIVDTPFSAEMDEKKLQDHLHEMSHSKVYAADKWGQVRLITQANIAELLAIVEASNFEKKTFYQNTLEDWQRGDFSNAVEVHNSIWTWHGGTVGKATRLMTEEEEQAYTRSNF
ncbi:hypothetical protein SAMN04487975_101400 [Planococcus glaciei]|uniref:DUF6241 domain-containing protein n=1 Tax=Planococcus glaciei TaxID=459472 RepID=UPI00088AC1A4|nr:DUF6241 domain-containing protein [Planococcus glaciei]SDG75878.1 hypothetical protein SAMN04487975_101400 [Planococcus glaciei]